MNDTSIKILCFSMGIILGYFIMIIMFLTIKSPDSISCPLKGATIWVDVDNSGDYTFPEDVDPNKCKVEG